MYKLDLDKAEEPEIKLPTSVGSYKKQENSRKTSASLTILKPLTMWITTTGKFVHRGCMLSSCLFNFYAEYIMGNAGLDES